MKRPSVRKIIGLVLTLSVLAGILYLFVLRNNEPQPPSETNKGYVNLKPATESDKADSESHKQDSANRSQPNSSTTSIIRGVNPIITTWSQSSTNLLVNGFVQGVIEDGGRCSLVLSHGTKTVSQSGTGIANSSSTSCGQIATPLSSLQVGTWQAVLNYASSTSRGSSTPQDIMVE